MSVTAGQILDGKYQILRVLGVGGMGSVYEGENTRIHRKVAIKVLHAAVAGKEEIVQRFEREAQAAGRIGSEHIVEVLDLGSLPGGERYMVMEYLEGDPLTKRIKVRGRLQPHDMAPVLQQLLSGLGAAHAAGIVHRDLKPDNIFLVRKNGYDFVKLLDFGVSKFSSVGEELSMTKTGAVMGTPYYMSPEQARGMTVDQRSDLYSVGVVAFQCLTGRVPFQAETFNELIFKIALEVPEPLETLVPNIDPGISAIVRRAMERDPAHRFQSAADFARALGEWQMANASGAAYVPAHAPQASPSGPGANGPAGLSQSGGFSSAPSFSQTGPGAALGTSGGFAPLGQSGASTPGMGGSGSFAAAPGANPSSPMVAAPPMAQSQVALAVTTGPSKKGTSIAIGVGVVALVGLAAGAFLWLRGPSRTATAATSAPTAEVSTTATATQTPPLSAQASAPTATAFASASAVETVEPVATAEPGEADPATAKPQAPGRPTTGRPAKSAKPDAPPPPTTTPGGRPIDDSL